MADKFKRPALFALKLLPFAAIGGFFGAIYSYEELTPQLKETILQQVPNLNVLYLMMTLQMVFYTLFCGFFGYVLAKKTGLWQPFVIEKKAMLTAAVIFLAGGIVLGCDKYIFGFIPQVAAFYSNKPNAANIIASVFYGGIIEEVMMRLFFMSLVAFVIWKLFFAKTEKPSVGICIAANVIAAVVFAAGHLPSTLQFFGTLTPMLLFRCFLMNGTFGIGFGYLYRKYGIGYAMIAHMGCHVIAKIILLVG